MWPWKKARNQLADFISDKYEARTKHINLIGRDNHENIARLETKIMELTRLMDERTPEGEARVRRIAAMGTRTPDPEKEAVIRENNARWLRMCNDINTLVSMVGGIAARQQASRSGATKKKPAKKRRSKK